MARIKKVFGSHSQLAHVWAQQKQADGRASRMFFNNTTDIYSYGHHYLAARVHRVKGKTFALVRSDSYSISTSGHLSDIRNALEGLMPFFCAPSVTKPKDAVKYLDKEAADTITTALKSIRIENERDITWKLSGISAAYRETNKLRKLIGLKAIKPKAKDLAAVKKHLEFRLKRFKELNTPAMQVKREEQRLKREARKQVLAEQKAAEDLANWRSFTFTHLHSLRVLPYEALRVRGDTLETSRGASVPLDAAQTLYRAIAAGKNVEGARIGHFRVDAVTDLGGDKAVKIGCHKILLSEAAKFLSPNLTLVKGA
jgi:hypothetical protein